MDKTLFLEELLGDLKSEKEEERSQALIELLETELSESQLERVLEYFEQDPGFEDHILAAINKGHLKEAKIFSINASDYYEKAGTFAKYTGNETCNSGYEEKGVKMLNLAVEYYQEAVKFSELTLAISKKQLTVAARYN